MKKYRLLLVEDEDIIRQGLMHMITKMDLNIDVVQASDGVEAIELCAANDIDILLTDISMPRMDGLSLISSLREQGNTLPCIIVSGFGEFEYARRAITYGVENYILKPIERSDLRKTLEKIIGEIVAAAKTIDASAALVQQEHARMQYDLWTRILTEGHIRLSEEEQALLSDIDFVQEALLILGMYKTSGSLYEELIKLEAGLAKVLFNYTAANSYIFHLMRVPKDTVSNLQRAYMGLNNVSSTMVSVLSAPCSSLQDLTTAYRQCTNSLNARLIRVLPCVQFTNNHMDANFAVPSYYFQNIRNYLELKDAGHAAKALDQLFVYLRSNTDLTPELLIECLQNLELFLLSCHSGQMIQIVPACNRLTSLDYLLGSSDNLDSFQETVLLRLQFICSVSTSNVPNSPIGIVLDFIENHYKEDISAVYCSNLISMNSSYFSTYFKKKTGLSFVNYLQQFRVRKSAELLRRTDLRVYEIAEQVGFSDEKYFFKIFKQYYSVTPNEFRSITENTSELKQ